MSYSRKPKRFLFFLLLVPALISVLAGVVMMLWNAILPDVLGVRPLNFGQALGILVLSRILFGGFGGGGKPPWRRPGHHSSVRGRWARMSADDKTRMREAWQQRCGRSQSSS